ncbi:MAG TPA: NADH-quinone oxidoreductase subunit L [Allosphingosinicella sp.]
MIQLIVFLPLLAALVAGFGNRLIGNSAAKLVTTGVLFASCALSWPIFLGFIAGTAEAGVHPVLSWIHSGDLAVDWSLRVDALTAVMLVVITTVSALVHLYSWGYMAEDPSQPRFFAYLSLFTFAMLMLVTADNLVQMFFGWEGVGLASYLLIGFWYHKPSANAAALKAFVVNRVGDFGFSLGIFATFLVFGTVSIPEILAAAPSMAGSSIGFLGMRLDTMTLICILLFIGAMGKSAQLGLHTWLPDAMEGPTPVSALIHAATMVTAGVYLVVRSAPIFNGAPNAQLAVAVVGAITLIFGAIIGFPGLSGFWSKDKIIEAAFVGEGWRPWVFGLTALVGAGITAFYMTRLFVMTFHGRRRWDDDVHPHESPKLMTVPLVVLAAGSALLGLLLGPTGAIQHWLEPVVGEHGEESPVLPIWLLTTLTVALVLVGAALAALMYLRRPVEARAPVGSVATRAARRDLYQDTVNESVFMRPGQYLTRSLVFFDNRGVDGAVNGLAALLGGSSGRFRRLQSGFVRSYALSMLVGAALVVGAMLLVRL